MLPAHVIEELSRRDAEQVRDEPDAKRERAVLETSLPENTGDEPEVERRIVIVDFVIN